jgi:hypothetical protein
VSGALISLFLQGHLQVENFTDRLSGLALDELAKKGKKRDKANTWVAQWILGLTQKQIQNVLRSDLEQIKAYIEDFEAAINEAAERCHEDFGNISMTLGFVEDKEGKRVQLNWKDIARLTTAIGSQTLAIRGSDKSMYGKLFERLLLGSFLTILGYERVNPNNNRKAEGVFWLAEDRSASRDSDATLIVRPGKIAVFDIGFIGPGNPEISKDKMSRWSREIEREGQKIASTTFIIIDRLKETGRTKKAAEDAGAEIVQMSMQYWVRDLARKLGERFGVEYELQKLDNGEISPYLEKRLAAIPVQDFLSGVSTELLIEQAEEEASEACPEEEE